MTKPGPKPTPTPMLRLAGSTVPGRSRRDEPKPKEGPPIKPRWLTGRAETVWKQVVKQMGDMGVLTVADGNAIARYCELMVRWVDDSKYIRDNGATYDLTDKNGEFKCVMPRPQVADLNQLSSQILRLEQEFGLTPSSRARLNVEPASKIPTVASRVRKA